MIEAGFYALVCAVFIQLCLLLYVYSKRKINIKTMGVAPGARLSKLSVYDPDGTVINLGGGMADKMSLIVFVSVNCNHCKELIPLLEQESGQRLGFQIFLISAGSELETQRLTAITGASLPLYRKPIQEVVNLRIRAYPFAMLTDENGIVQKRGLLKKTEINTWFEPVTEPQSLFQPARGIKA